MAAPLQRTSLADMAVDELIRLIEDSKLKEHDKLPPTTELADILGVSRTVVREAIAKLAGQGILEHRQGREAVVKAPDSSQFERFFRLRFAVNGADYKSLQEYREVIEVGAARLAAQRATPDDIAAITERLNKLRGAATEDEQLRYDQDFHREVARASGNDMILLSIDGITPLLIQLRKRAWAGWTQSGKGVTTIMDAHAAILDQIKAHNPDGASTMMAHHLAQATEGLLYTTQPTPAP